mmetsp:Transcript_4141/g.10530  ORF Transcript_4141/g.10530 Transcript_4141/m.10530 type:complete len:221 (-) Transcript_4141:130-792(-)
MSCRKWLTTEEGMMKPTFSASSLPWNATPMTWLLSALSAGPPEFPELSAASIWTQSREKPLCAYSCTSTRDTTPAVTHKLSPPVGKPTTTKLCWSSGTAPNSRAHVPSQNSSSSTERRARSHSWPTASTLAGYLRGMPWRCTSTQFWLAMLWAFVRILLPCMMNPLPVPCLCLRICHGWEKWGSVVHAKTLTTDANPACRAAAGEDVAKMLTGWCTIGGI